MPFNPEHPDASRTSSARHSYGKASISPTTFPVLATVGLLPILENDAAYPTTERPQLSF